MKYDFVVCGGTFDHFHKGHKEFLRFALSQGENLIIGLTSDEYVNKSKIPTSPRLRGASKIQSSGFIESCEERRSALLSFLKQEGVLDRVEVVKIEDIFGPTLDRNLQIDSIVVSKDTTSGAEFINKKRKEIELTHLKVLIVPSVKGEDGKIISSRRIREGTINRDGKLFLNPLWLKKDIVITEDLRQKLKKPFGILFKQATLVKNSNAPYVITVGDITSLNFNRLNLGQDISVIDFNVARQKKFSSLSQLGFEGNEKVITASNPPGHITSDLTLKVSSLFARKTDKRIILKIEGEEDLAVIPLVISAPLNTVIYYGQPDKGLVQVEVSENNKEKVYSLLMDNTRGH